ncbi:uncharacterized protein BP5553_07671 [Venustampulla echinocandica]|uniref:DUF202 domain-containing protein n=1 Tax=Venustampulla echinocandica TaxID=2656787 RepID=A0A370TH74_9HELO|nr:uncharacterized protein BP5553_07671 [Venustampulla echinocandica]RDL34543.1 hypothetical protein BP5553_07671 [Venustampulla echinocandica]
MSAANSKGGAAPPATPNSARVRDSPKAVVRPQRGSTDDILQGRTQEAASNNTSPHYSGPGGTSHRRANMLRSSAATYAEPESSADEETSIVRKPGGQNPNYQSTAQKPATALRSRPSTASIRRTGRVYQPEDDANNDNGSLADEHMSWWARILSEYGSIELENKGSVARDHLALERTFLAWLRTSLAFASIGIAITQLQVPQLPAFHSSEKSTTNRIPQFPTQCHGYRQPRRVIPTPSTHRKAPWRDVFGHKHRDARHRVPQIFRISTLDNTGEIPGE